MRKPRDITPGQSLLSLIGSADEAPVATVADVEQLVGVLERCGQQTAAEVCVELGWIANENNKRKIRKAASAGFPGILSFVGSAGYKLLKHCTLEEAYAAEGALANDERVIVLKRKLLLDAIHSGKVGRP